MAEYAAKCRVLANKCIQLVNSYRQPASLPQLIDQHGIIPSLDIPLHSLVNTSSCIAIRNILVHPLLRISIYNIPPATAMTLHDHPSMNVLTYIMEGRVKAEIFSKAQG